METDVLDLERMFEALPLCTDPSECGIVEIKYYKREVVASSLATNDDDDDNDDVATNAANDANVDANANDDAASITNTHHASKSSSTPGKGKSSPHQSRSNVETRVYRKRRFLAKNNVVVMEKTEVKKHFQNQLTIVWRFKTTVCGISNASTERVDMATTNGFIFRNGKIKAVGLKCDTDVKGSYAALLAYFQRHLSHVHTMSDQPIQALTMDDPYATMYNTDFSVGFNIVRDTLVEIVRERYPWIECHYEPDIYPAVKIRLPWNYAYLNDGERYPAVAHCYCEAICGCDDDEGTDGCDDHATLNSAKKKKKKCTRRSHACVPACDGKGSGFKGNGDCKVVTVCIFQSGQIIITGGNHPLQIAYVYKFVNGLLKTHYESVYHMVPYVDGEAPVVPTKRPNKNRKRTNVRYLEVDGFEDALATLTLE